MTYADLFYWGLSGTTCSRQHRYALLERLGLPPRLSKKAFLDVLNSLYTFEEIEAIRLELSREKVKE
ncbi:Small primase-like protein (Toprim domain) [gut metagenome]|uniref:Small primase-like protein (Toprim domain) n=1 Tax=gut metagenome TaxID=749906 RepID=J9FPB5_9ZZZZ